MAGETKICEFCPQVAEVFCEADQRLFSVRIAMIRFMGSTSLLIGCIASTFMVRMFRN